jgi:GNAT superfamily N-acetyltransferase
MGCEFMIVIRNYNREEDYERINQFLIDIYKPKSNIGWVHPKWELMHYHPNTEDEVLSKIGIFEIDGEIVAVVTHDGVLGEAYFLVHPQHIELKPKLIQYAEDNLGKQLENGRHQLTVYIQDGDRKFEKFVHRKRYKTNEEPVLDKLLSRFPMNQAFPNANIPKGYRLINLSIENNIEKLAELLHKGYELEGEVKQEEIEGYRHFQNAPNFDPTLHMVAVAPNGQYVAYCGIWYEPQNKIAYIEPVCTLPKYRNKGLGKACVVECMFRVKHYGVKEIIAGSGLEFFQAIGFKPQVSVNDWTRQY